MLDTLRRLTEQVTSIVAREVRRQMKVIGLVTREELSELKRRVRHLERAAARSEAEPSPDPSQKPVTRKPAPKPAAGATARKPGKKAAGRSGPTSRA